MSPKQKVKKIKNLSIWNIPKFSKYTGKFIGLNSKFAFVVTTVSSVPRERSK